MNHKSLSRPNLPGTTVSPAPSGKTSVYATRIPPHFHSTNSLHRQETTKRSPDIYHDPVLEKDVSTTMFKSPSIYKVLQDHGLSKIVDKLPYELRESVSSVLRLAFSASETIEKDLELSHTEVAVLRTELTKKTRELQTLQKTCDIYKNQLNGLEENIDSLKDNIESRNRFTNRNRSAMSRLATTNRMLIDALDALQNPIGANIGKSLSNTNSGLEIPRPGQLSPLSLPRTPKGINHKEYEEKVQRLTMSQNDKLRESLLKIAREHYRSLKNAEHLETKVNELKGALKAQEQLNRNLKSELDEIKAITQAETSLTTEDKHAPEALTTFKAKNFGHIDDRIQNLIDKNLFDPIDGIQQLRRILGHMANAPNSLSLHEMIVHVVSRDAVRIFGSDMICLFLVKPGSENLIHKFTSRSIEPTTIEINSTKSIAAESIKTGKVQRVNAVSKNTSYNEEIDGCSGVVTKRVLTLPLFNTQHSFVIGALQFLNKGRNFEVFTEADEVFGLIFAHQTSLLLTSCVMYDALFYHSQLLRGLLEASTDLYSIIPDASALSVKSLTPGEVIAAMERTARELLKCPSVKAFLVSDFLNLPNGQLVMLENNSNNVSASRRNTKSYKISFASATSGVAGHVVQSKQQYIIEPYKFDPFLNPSVDLDPLKYSMLTTPIIDLLGNVLGCMQLLIGNRSPRLKESDDPNDFRLLFPQAAQWLNHQLAPPLKYILSYLDRPVLRPVSTPSKISRSSMDAHHRASFFSNSEEVVNQMVAVAAQFKDEMATDGTKQLEGGTFVSVPFHHTSTAKSFKLIAPESLRLDTSESPRFYPSDGGGLTTNLRIDNQHFGPSSVDNTAHEMLQIQLIEKQKEYELLFERLQTLEKDFDERSGRFSDKNKGYEEKYKKKIIDLEDQYYAKQEILKKDYENKITLLEEELKTQKEEIIALQESHEGYEKNLHFQLEKRLEYENKIVELEEQLKHHHANETDSQLQASNLNSELQKKNLVIVELQERYATTIELNQANKTLIEQQSNELQRNHTELVNYQQTIRELQDKLIEKDSLQKILQDQVIRLAGQNIKEINAVMGEVVAPTPNDKLPIYKNVSLPTDQFSQLDQPLKKSGDVTKELNNGWIEQKDMLGRSYYYNESTGESSWTDPSETSAKLAHKTPIRKGEWLQQFDESGNEYWINQITGQSEWLIPEDALTSYEKQDEDDEDQPVNHDNEPPSIFDTTASQYSATAGDYTIEL